MKTLCFLWLSLSAVLASGAEPELRLPAQSREAEQAKQTLDAILLFEDGQARLHAGKYGTAALAFQTLIAVYPESPLVPQATEALRIAERREAQHLHARTLRSLRFENLTGVNEQEVLERFAEREIELAVQKSCDTRMVAQARSALTELLAERGMANAHVEIRTRDISRGGIEITFKVTKTSRLGALLARAIPGV